MNDNFSSYVTQFEVAENDALKVEVAKTFGDALDVAIADLEKASRDVSEAEDALNLVNEELAELEKQEADIKDFSVSDSMLHKSQTPNCQVFFDFISFNAVTLGELLSLEASFRGIAEGEAVNISGDWFGTRFVGSDEWSRKKNDLANKINELDNTMPLLKSCYPLYGDGENVTKLLSSVDTLRSKAATASTLAASRKNECSVSRTEMETERIGLLTWCRQQKTNLDAMVEPDHAQEFCSSLLSNFASMDKNFQVLLDFTFQLPLDESLQKDMLECNEVWLNLQVSAYERMRHALIEVHPKSKLEDEVREFASFTDEVLGFIKNVRELFSNTNDPESDSFVRPVLEDADALLLEYSMHETIPKQLQEFCNRMDCLRDAYSNLRRAVLSRLTFLTNSVPPLTASMRRKEEYVARMRDLKTWVEIKSQGETWSDVHERILSIKSLIEQEQISLGGKQ